MDLMTLIHWVNRPNDKESDSDEGNENIENSKIYLDRVVYYWILQYIVK